MKKLLYIALLFCTNSASAAEEYSIYFSTTNSAAGDGTIGNPYKALASAPWATITNLSAGGTNVFLKLQQGSVFREQWTFSGFAPEATPLCVVDYAGTNTAKPTISGANALTNWILFSGTTYTNTAAFTPSSIRANGKILTRAATTTALRPGEYTNETAVVYVRWDAGDPDDLGAVIEGVTRTYCVSETGDRDNVRWTNIVFRSAGTGVFRMAGTSTDNRIFDGCEFDSLGGTIIWGDSTNTIWRGCKFTGNSGAAITCYTNSSVGKFYFCLFTDLATGISVTGSNDIQLINCTFVKLSSHAVIKTGAGTMLADNCIFSALGSKPTTAGNEVLTNGAGIFTVNNSTVLTTPHDFAQRPLGITWGTGNLIRDPQFAQASDPGIYIVTVDDTASLPYAIRLRVPGNARNNYVGSAVFEEGWVFPDDSDRAQDLILTGNEVANHTRDHFSITNYNAFRIWYVGAGSSCLLSVSASNLTTAVTGAAGDNLDIALTNYNQNDLLVAINNHAAYNASNISSTVMGATVPSVLITNLTEVELKPGPYVVPYDYGLTFTNQIVTWKSQLESYFTNANGSAWTNDVMYYPYGSYSDTETYALTNVGFIGGRSINAIATSRDYPCTKDWFNVMRFPIQKSPYQQSACLRFENALTEENGKTFAGSNVTYTTSGIWESVYAGVFNGSNTVIYSADHADFDFSERDWMVSVTVTPTTLAGTNTIYYQGNDSDNYTRIALLADGSIQYLVVSNAQDVVNVTSAAGYTANSRQTRIAIQQRTTEVWMFTNWVKIHTETNVLRGPDNYTNQIFLGTTFGGLDYYNGSMDLFEVLKYPWQNAASLVSTFSESGFVSAMYQHNEYSLSVDQIRNVWDAMQENGFVTSPTMHNAVLNIKTNGTSSDGLSYYWTTAKPAADYTLRSTSPLINAGRTNYVTGVGGLKDYSGNAVTDSDGVISSGLITIGAFNTQASSSEGEAEVPWPSSSSTNIPVIVFPVIGDKPGRIIIH